MKQPTHKFCLICKTNSLLLSKWTRQIKYSTRSYVLALTKWTFLWCETIEQLIINSAVWKQRKESESNRIILYVINRLPNHVCCVNTIVRFFYDTTSCRNQRLKFSDIIEWKHWISVYTVNAWINDIDHTKQRMNKKQNQTLI